MKKKVNTSQVAKTFSDIFLERIDESRAGFIDFITDEEYGGLKLSVKRQEADIMLFYGFLMYWTLPVVNLFEHKIAESVLKKACEYIAESYGTDPMTLYGRIVELRAYYQNNIVKDMQMMRGSAWLLDELTENAGLGYIVADTYLIESLPLNWKVVSEKFKIVI